MENRIKIKLTTEERDLIINEIFTDPVLLEPLEKGQVKDDLITVYYAPHFILFRYYAYNVSAMEHYLREKKI